MGSNSFPQRQRSASWRPSFNSSGSHAGLSSCRRSRAFTRTPNSSQATREATAVVFDSFHRYLGVAVGECLGYLLTGTWTLLIAVAMLSSSSFADWLAWPGIAIGASLALGSLEFVGRFEEHGWKLAGTIVPFAYTAWSLWLLAAGIVLIV
jgi:hypothetical protein